MDTGRLTGFGFQDPIDIRRQEVVVVHAMLDSPYITLLLDAIGEGYAELRIIQPQAEKAMERSMQRYGQLTPVVVGQENGRYEMVDGFKRLRAGRRLGYERLQARVMPGGRRAMKAAIIYLNTKVRTIAEIESALVIRSLYREDHLSQVEIALLLNRHKSFVCRRLKLVEKLNEEVLEHLKLGLINITIGRELSRLPSGNQAKALSTILKYRLTSSETAKLVGLVLQNPRWNHDAMVVFIRNRQELEHQIILLHAEGWSIRALSKHFNMGRNTVRRIIRENRRQREQGHDAIDERRPVPRKSKLDAFKPLIQEILEKYPDITGVRMCEELAAGGFDGGRTIVTDYLRKIRPRPKKEPEVRFETPPGYQGQMDWSPYTLNFTRSGRHKVLCFSYILGFSRRQYIDFTTDRKFYTLIRRHQDAFAHFNGVPHTCLYDGEKTVILRWEAGQPVFNPAFVAFITHYHCRPVGCLPGRAKTKGKIEAPFQYIEKNLLNARDFEDFQHLRQMAAWWLANRSDLHIHDTTGRAPLELFLEQEQTALKALPANPYDSAEVALRVCRLDGFLEHETNLYSVPYEYIADILTLKATEHEIIVYSPELRVIARHERKPLGAAVKIEDPDHRKSEKVRYGLEPVKEAFLSLGESAEEFLQGLKRRHPRNCGFQARYILRLKENYHCEDIHQALVHATKYYAFDGKTVERILKARYEPRTLEMISARSISQCFELLPEIKQRPLEAYRGLFKESCNA